MTNNSLASLRSGERAAKEGMLSLVLLGTIKIIAGLMTGMTVIIADAISTFADTLGIFASYMGLRLSRKSADEHFSYGYYKIETFAALVISLGIIYLGYYILRESIDTFLNPETGQNRIFALITTTVSVLMSYRLYKKLMAAGKNSNSLSLIASAKDKKMDVFSSIAVLISIIANYKQIPYVEGVVSAIIAIFILKVGLESSKESLFFLLDYWNDPGLLKQIRGILNQEKDLIVKVKRIQLRRAGTFIFGQAYVELNPFADILDLREELLILQRKIENLNPYIKDFPIYNHIPKSEIFKVAVPIKDNKDLQSEIASSLSETTAYLFAEIRGNKIEKYYIKKLEAGQKKPTQLDNFLKQEKVNILIDNKLNSLIYYNLRRTHHVLIYPSFSDVKKVEDMLQLLLIDT